MGRTEEGDHDGAVPPDRAGPPRNALPRNTPALTDPAVTGPGRPAPGGATTFHDRHRRGLRAVAEAYLRLADDRDHRRSEWDGHRIGPAATALVAAAVARLDADRRPGRGGSEMTPRDATGDAEAFLATCVLLRDAARERLPARRPIGLLDLVGHDRPGDDGRGDDGRGDHGPLDEAARRALLVAFASLDDRDRVLVWMTAAEGILPVRVATLLAVERPDAVTAATDRARARLIRAYEQARPDAPGLPLTAVAVDAAARVRKRTHGHARDVDGPVPSGAAPSGAAPPRTSGPPPSPGPGAPVVISTTPALGRTDAPAAPARHGTAGPGPSAGTDAHGPDSGQSGHGDDGTGEGRAGPRRPAAAIGLVVLFVVVTIALALAVYLNRPDAGTPEPGDRVSTSLPGTADTPAPTVSTTRRTPPTTRAASSVPPSTAPPTTVAGPESVTGRDPAVTPWSAPAWSAPAWTPPTGGSGTIAAPTPTGPSTSPPTTPSEPATTVEPTGTTEPPPVTPALDPPVTGGSASEP